MTNTCWNAMTSIMSGVDGIVTNNAPAIVPYYLRLFEKVVRTLDSAARDKCDPLNANAAGAFCKLTNDVNLYREFTNIKLINATTRYTGGSYLVDMQSNIAGNGEHYIYGSNAVS